MRKLLFIFFITSIASCTTLDVYEKTKPFSKQEWSSIDTTSFKFDIIDTNSFYNFYFVLRHQEKYPYKNIWLSLTVKDPDTTSIIKREFGLADNNKWLGSTIDDITDHRIIFNPQPIKLKKGSYSFTLKQIMRDDPLPNILSAGIRVQKVGQ
jgi:hypothetical protein